MPKKKYARVLKLNSALGNQGYFVDTIKDASPIFFKADKQVKETNTIYSAIATARIIADMINEAYAAGVAAGKESRR